jgi:hypothetical protein
MCYFICIYFIVFWSLLFLRPFCPKYSSHNLISFNSFLPLKPETKFYTHRNR